MLIDMEEVVPKEVLGVINAKEEKLKRKRNL